MPDTPLSWTRFSVQSSEEELTNVVVRNRYRFGQMIGRGGMADVYAGEFLPIARKVAIKVLRMSADAETQRRFRREFRLHTTITHPALVRALDFDETADGRFFYTMEQLRGRSLDHVFGIGTRVDPARVVRIGIQVCAVLHHLHQRGIVHRDIKPGNVFLLAESDDQIKLLDLGVARLTTGFYANEELRTPTSRREHTKTGLAMGTQGFAPPECGHEKAESCHDIYSTGVMLYRLLTAKRPSRPDETPTRVTAYVRDLPRSLADAIERALAPKPDDRFSSAEEFQHALEDSLSELRGRTRARSVEAAPPKSRSSWRTIWMGVALGLVCGVALTNASNAITEPVQARQAANTASVASRVRDEPSRSTEPVQARQANTASVASRVRDEPSRSTVRAAAHEQAPLAQAQTKPVDAPVAPALPATAKAQRRVRARAAATAHRELTRISQSLEACLRFEGSNGIDVTLSLRVADGAATLRPETPVARQTQRCIDRVVHEVDFGAVPFTTKYTLKP